MHVADLQKVLPDVSMKTPVSPFGDGADEHSICFSNLGEALIHTDLVLTNYLLIVCRNLAEKRAVGSASREIHCRKKYFSVRTIRKDVIDHSITVITTIERVLLKTLIRAFSWNRNSIHEPNNVIYERFP